MSILDELHAAANHHNNKNRPCPVCVHLEKMEPRVKEGVELALEGNIGQKKLADIMTRHGFPTSEGAVAKHRKEHL